MQRTGWLAVAALGCLAVGGGIRLLRPSPRPALPCDPADVRWVEVDGTRIARCAPALPRANTPAAQALTVGQKLDLTTASEADLEVLPGVGPALAHTIVQARAAHPFRTWDDVDRIPGVGPAKLELLKGSTRLGDR